MAEIPRPAAVMAAAIGQMPGMKASGATPRAVAARASISREAWAAPHCLVPYHTPAIALPKPVQPEQRARHGLVAVVPSEGNGRQVDRDEHRAPRQAVSPASTRRPGLRSGRAWALVASAAGGSVCRCRDRPATPATLNPAVTSTAATGLKPEASATTSTGPVMKISSSAMPSSENAASSRAMPPSSRLQRERTTGPREGMVARLRPPVTASAHTGARPAAHSTSAAVAAVKTVTCGRSTRACPYLSARRAAGGVTTAYSSAPAAETARRCRSFP